VQLVVLTIADRHHEHGQKVIDFLKKHDFRASIDLRNEKIGFKIREHTLHKVPYLVVIGDREVEERCVSLRKRDGTDLGSLSLSALVDHLNEDVATLARCAD
jgi:threonyl-tRNA synthetase